MATVNERDDAAVQPPGPGFGPSVRLAPAPIDRRSLNIPNAITLSRLILAIMLFAMIGYPGWWMSSAVLFVVAASTDFLDGYFARKYGQVTTLGRIMDPFVDKIIVGGAFLFLMRHDAGVSAWMVLIVLGREMFVTSLRGFMEQHGIDFSADRTGKLKMVLQCIAVTVALLSMSRLFIVYPAFQTFRDLLLWGMTAFTAYSGIAYFMRAMRALRDHLARA
ncbi:MAG: CDP-diacylglycerol--glycerol-3-phosphate 3-phosphatidyltransferase [Planctomycetota bacterium]|nr:CDP-diacylglycerol--glycerol-3-phosphate 3-phosphatidyltransferase [Planctomycetaceae bacterium]MDQ3330863.1 CDP-diacylglycerol--glycerol-3-phosphate 3-phosphatidyltransferase [Planctomycetota bacterium]